MIRKNGSSETKKTCRLRGTFYHELCDTVREIVHIYKDNLQGCGRVGLPEWFFQEYIFPTEYAYHAEVSKVLEELEYVGYFIIEQHQEDRWFIYNKRQN